jgi:hypothetical protein
MGFVLTSNTAFTHMTLIEYGAGKGRMWEGGGSREGIRCWLTFVLLEMEEIGFVMFVFFIIIYFSHTRCSLIMSFGENSGGTKKAPYSNLNQHPSLAAKHLEIDFKKKKVCMAWRLSPTLMNTHTHNQIPPQ